MAPHIMVRIAIYYHQCTLDLIKHLYPIRTCSLNLSPENIKIGKYNVCLEYHIKIVQDLVLNYKHDEYMRNIAEIKEILKGNTSEINKAIFQKMNELATELKFEEAQILKRKYDLIENYRSKSEVVLNTTQCRCIFY